MTVRQLLSQYTQTGSEPAFAELVRQLLNQYCHTRADAAFAELTRPRAVPRTGVPHATRRLGRLRQRGAVQ